MRLVLLIVVVIVACAGFTARAVAQLTTAFTYQGYLEASGTPFTGNADFQFQVYSASTGGSPLAGTITVTNVPVTRGVFTTNVDFFSTTLFADAPRWLSVLVRTPAGSGTYTQLGGRQLMAPAPLARFAVRSELADEATTLTGVTRSPAGQFGFGTPTPGARLHVQDTGFPTARFESTSVTGAWLQLVNSAAGGHGWSLISTGPGNGEGVGKLLFSDITSGGPRMTIDTAGKVGIGTVSPAEKLEVAGNIKCDVLIIDGGSDVSESYDVARHGELEAVPGMVVSIDPDRVGKLRIASGEYDRTVAGIISGANGVAPGLVLNHAGTVADGRHPVANVGRVWCLVDADAGGEIRAGDLLTTSSTPGHAMKVRAHDRANGAVLGKAMSSLKEGKGIVLVLVGLQ